MTPQFPPVMPSLPSVLSRSALPANPGGSFLTGGPM
jgi:hypothetical protein